MIIKMVDLLLSLLIKLLGAFFIKIKFIRDIVFKDTK